MAPREQIKEQYQQFARALKKLNEIVQLEKSEIVRDSTIQRFEFTYEVLWKLLKSLARERDIECLSPRDSFGAAFRMGLIAEEQEALFISMIERRNLTVHVYHEETAAEIYEFIRTTAVGLLNSMQCTIDAYLASH